MSAQVLHVLSLGCLLGSPQRCCAESLPWPEALAEPPCAELPRAVSATWAPSAFLISARPQDRPGGEEEAQGQALCTLRRLLWRAKACGSSWEAGLSPQAARLPEQWLRARRPSSGSDHADDERQGHRWPAVTSRRGEVLCSQPPCRSGCQGTARRSRRFQWAELLRREAGGAFSDAV